MTEPNEIYIVTASLGSYDSHSEWNVAAFSSEEDANLFQMLCEEHADKQNERYREVQKPWMEFCKNLMDKGIFKSFMDDPSYKTEREKYQNQLTVIRKDDHRYDPDFSSSDFTTYSVSKLVLNPNIQK